MEKRSVLSFFVLLSLFMMMIVLVVAQNDNGLETGNDDETHADLTGLDNWMEDDVVGVNSTIEEIIVQGVIVEEFECEWACTRWSVCSEDIQTRSCVDVNECGTDENKPFEEKRCNEELREMIKERIQTRLKAAMLQQKINQRIKEKINEGRGTIEDGVNETQRTVRGIGQELREEIRQRKQEIREGNITGPQGRMLDVNKIAEGLREMRVERFKAQTRMNITEEVDENNQTRLRVMLSNGNEIEMKVMPDTAAKRALEKLKLNRCEESEGCVLELKEVPVGSAKKLAYQIQRERKARFLGIIPANMEVEATVDAETGDIISLKKPWWAFLAREPVEEEVELVE